MSLAKAEKNQKKKKKKKKKSQKINSTYLDVLDQASSVVGHFLGGLDKVSLGHRVVCLAAGDLAGIAQYAGVFGYDCGSCKHLLQVG